MFQVISTFSFGKRNKLVQVFNLTSHCDDQSIGNSKLVEDLGNYMDEEEEGGEEIPIVGYNDSLFDFTRFEMGYVAESTVSNYMNLLKNFKYLKASTLRFITKMFHRIFVVRGMEAIFYRVCFRIIFAELSGIMLLFSLKG